MVGHVAVRLVQSKLLIHEVLVTIIIDYCRVLPKRATAVQFTSDDQYILVSDKAGDLHRYTLTSDPTSPGEHLLGHFSMLLDMVCS
jgi:hypothetical protein